MYDKTKSLESFYKLLSELPHPEDERYLEVWLSNGRKISFKIDLTNNRIEEKGLRLVMPGESSSPLKLYL